MKSLCISSSEELLDYQDQWERLREDCGGMIYCSHALTNLWLKVFASVASPRVILIEDRDELVGVAPFAASRYSVAGVPFKVLALVGDVEHRLRLSSSSVLFSPERNDILEKMVEEIRYLDWNKFMASNMQDTLATRRFIQGMGSEGRPEGDLPGKMFVISLPETDDIAKTFTKKARKNTTRLLNRLEREQSSFRFEKISIDGMNRAVDIYAKQHVERWQAKGGSMFRHPENADFVKQAMKLMLTNRSGFAYQLLIENEVTAQLLGFLDEKGAYGFRLGMSNKFARYSPGWIIHYLALEDLRAKGIRTYYMGLGNEDYKHWMGGEDRMLPGVKVNRGVAYLLIRLASSPTFQRIDSGIGIRRNALRVRSSGN